MVRIESKNQPLPAANRGSYMYDQTYTSFWDSVLQERPGSNDRSFEKKDMKQEEAAKACQPADVTAANCSPTRHHLPDTSEMKEEKKCADEDLILEPSKSDDAPAAISSEASPTPTHSTTEEGTTTEEEGTSSFEEEEADETAERQYESPVPPADEETEPGEVTVTTDDDIPPPEKHENEEVHPSESSVKVTSEDKAEGEESQSQESSLVEQLKAVGKPEPEMISQMMAKIVTDAAKKELEARLQQQKEQKEQEQEHATTTETLIAEPLAQIPEADLSIVEEIPLDAESLAKAHAKLLEQAKSLAKAQALIQRQAKALALIEQQQQQQHIQHVSPSDSPERAQQTSTTRSSPPRTSPSHPKPNYGRAPSDAPSDEFCMKSSNSVESSPISAANLAASLALPDTNESDLPTKQQVVSHQGSELSQSAKSDTTEITSNTLNPLSPPRIATAERGDTDLADWLNQAKSEAQKKAQELIRTVQSEAAARSQLRKEAKERAMMEEKLRLKEEAENRIKAKAVRDAWEWEQTQAAFKAEEKARLRSKAELKAAAEDKMRRKADTDAATHNVMDAQRAQLKAETEYKLRLKADMDARWLAECKAKRIKEAQARQKLEAMEREKQAQEEKEAAAILEAERKQKILEMADAQSRANEEQKSRQKQEAMNKENIKAESDVEDKKAKMEAERQRVLKEMAAAQARANAEHKLRMKAEADAKWLAQCKARRIAEAKEKEQAIAEQKAEAKVRAKATAEGRAKTGELPPSKDQGILASLPGAQSWAAAKKLLLEAPKEFVPFAKSKGEEAKDSIILYLQVPGVVHVSEVKVELEDGVLYISRGIVLEGVEGVQKYTRSFPFEEQLLDTNRISVTLIPSNATADNVSVLRFTLPKVQSTWKIPLLLSAEEDEEEEKDETADSTDNDTKDMTEVSLDAPDDEVSLVHPSDEMKSSTTGGDAENKAETNESSVSAPHSVQDKNGTRTLTLEVPTGLALGDISAVYGNDSVRVVGKNSSSLSFRHVVPMNSKEVQVRNLEGRYNPKAGLLLIKGLLKLGPSTSKPKSRRIKVSKMEEIKDATGIISLFQDDASISSNHSHPTQSSPEHKKKGAKTLSIKSMASKYLRLKPKKHKHDVP